MFESRSSVENVTSSVSSSCSVASSVSESLSVENFHTSTAHERPSAAFAGTRATADIPFSRTQRARFRYHLENRQDGFSLQGLQYIVSQPISRVGTPFLVLILQAKKLPTVRLRLHGI